MIFKSAEKDTIELNVGNKKAEFVVQDYKLNMWHTLCSTWDSTSGLVQLWFNGKPSVRKLVARKYITTPIIVLGQVRFLNSSIAKNVLIAKFGFIFMSVT